MSVDSRTDLHQYLKPIFLCLLTRMHANKTDKFVYLFSKFFLYTMAVNVEGLTPDSIISIVEEIQPQFVTFANSLSSIANIQMFVDSGHKY